jgi:hypothetical protein
MNPQLLILFSLISSFMLGTFSVVKKHHKSLVIHALFTFLPSNYVLQPLYSLLTTKPLFVKKQFNPHIFSLSNTLSVMHAFKHKMFSLNPQSSRFKIPEPWPLSSKLKYHRYYTHVKHGQLRSLLQHIRIFY